MARTANKEAREAKREAILDAALRLIYAKGYEAMSVQDILDALKMPKGALYHYFDSKDAVLDALIERMTDEIDNAVQPILRDPKRSALQKLQGYIDASSSWKRDHATQAIPLLQVWYSEKNDLVRQRFSARLVPKAAHTLESVVKEGVAEGAFTTRFPEEAALLLIQLSVGVSEMITRLVLSPKRGETPRKIKTMVRAYVDAMERILGAPTGSLKPPAIGSLPKLPLTKLRHE